MGKALACNGFMCYMYNKPMKYGEGIPRDKISEWAKTHPPGQRNAVSPSIWRIDQRQFEHEHVLVDPDHDTTKCGKYPGSK